MNLKIRLFALDQHNSSYLYEIFTVIFFFSVHACTIYIALYMYVIQPLAVILQ